jgi:hypothetical protein
MNRLYPWATTFDWLALRPNHSLVDFDASHPEEDFVKEAVDDCFSCTRFGGGGKPLYFFTGKRDGYFFGK